jgi:hypothetical protein
MNKLIVSALLCLASITASAQQTDGPFRAYLINKQYDIVMRINFYQQDVTVPGQDLFGQVPGYLSKRFNSFAWIITDAQVKGHKATLQMINDYGSEDLTATLTVQGDSVFVLKQESGSTLKVPLKGKWQKLPKTMEFKRQK